MKRRKKTDSEVPKIVSAFLCLQLPLNHKIHKQACQVLTNKKKKKNKKKKISINNSKFRYFT